MDYMTSTSLWKGAWDLTEVTVPNLQWFGDKPLTLEFPDEWDVKRCRMACEGQHSLSEAEIKAALENPIGTRPLSKLAESADEVVILIDDMTRPTRSHQYVEPILKVLHGAGIPVDNIRFIMATGAHGTVSRLDFVKKIGDDVVADYQCYNHNPYEYLDYLGETGYGTPVYVNSEVMSCDLKVGVGTVLFHRLMGFSGGGKMILPGVAGLDTIEHNHGNVGGFGPQYTAHETTGYLKHEGNVMRLDCEEAARLAGLDFKLDSVLNLERNPIELYTGDPAAAWERVEEQWGPLKRSLLLQVQVLRTESHFLRGRCALAAAAQGLDRKRLLRIAKRHAAKLAREGMPWIEPFAPLLRAGIRSIVGDSDRARELLAAAAAGFDRADLRLYAAAARRRLGQLTGGTEGEELIRQADELMRSEQIPRPDRVTEVLAPGFLITS